MEGARSGGEKQEKRTLTNLYNARPTWLDNAHRKLDEAVFAAYGWPSDLSDDDILARLLELNLKRSGTVKTSEVLPASPQRYNIPPHA